MELVLDKNGRPLYTSISREEHAEMMNHGSVRRGTTIQLKEFNPFCVKSPIATDREELK